MAKNVGNIAHKKSSMVSTDSEGKVLGPKLPEASALIEGEIAVNYAKGYETLSIKNSSGDIATFSCDATIQNTINSSVDSKINETVGDIGTLKSELSTHTGNTDIHVNSEQVAAIAAVSSKANISDLTAHTANTTVHITADERNAWNAVSGKADADDVYIKGEVDTELNKKLDASAYTATDLSAYSTTEQMNSAISSAVAPKANSSDVYTKTEADGKFQHVGNYVSSATLNAYSTTEQMNSAISSAVAPKANAADVYTKAEVYTKDEADSAFQAKGSYVSSTTLNDYSTTSQVEAKISVATSGKADSSTVTSLNNSLTGHTTNGTIHITADERSKWNAKAEVSKIPTKVSQLTNDKNFISYAKYDDAAKKINFYADSASTAVVSIDATAFVKDGMVNSASVSGSNLVITFNTDAGKDNIAIPISSIFNANNYYTTANTYSKTEVDNKLATKSNTGHTHAISGVTGLQSALDGKSPTSHTHVISGVTGLQAALDGKSNTGHIHAISDVTNLQSALDGKSGTGHTHNYAGSSTAGGAATTANKVANALTLKLNGASAQTYNGSSAIEFNVTPSGIGAAASSHNHNYAGSSSVGGAANSAVTLTTATAGSATQPVYFTGGKPAACTYTLEKSVPSDAVFTDTNTHYASNTIVASAANATSNGAASNGNVYLNHIENGSVRNAHKIVGGGATSVTSDTAGTITISSTNTTYGTATTSSNGLMSSSDKSKLDGIQAGADAVSFSRSLSSGTKIGTLTINGTGTDLYCQTNTDTNTTYSAGAGIGLNGTQFYNAGVRSISAGTDNGTISVNTNGTSANVAVKGLGSAAYTNSNAYAAASHSHDDRYYTESETNNLLNAKLPLAGGTMTGALTVQKGGVWVQGGSAAGGDVSRMTTTLGMPTELAYNTSKRGTRIYSNAIAFADPYNGNTNNDAGWIRHLETTANEGTFEIAVGDDGNESIVVRQYNTSNSVSREAYLLNGSGNSSFPGTVSAAAFSGNASSASKWAAARTITLAGAVTGSANVDGSANVTLTTAVNHTHNYAGSSSAGGAATSANKVANALTLQFNGTTNQTYDGSAARTFNVTPAAIGAAASSHSHNYAGSSSAGGAANSVAGTLTLQLNGTTNQTYNGSAAKTFNVTPAAIGAAPSSHSHNYAGSSSAGGAANSVANALTLQFNGTTNQTYNGSGAKTFNVTPAAIGALPKAAQQFSAVTTSSNLTNVGCPFTLADGQNGTVMYYNSGSANVTITVSTNYKTPTNQQLNITIVPKGYGEVNYLRFNSNMIVARGL